MLKLCALFVIILAKEPASAQNQIQNLPPMFQPALEQFQISYTSATAQANPIIEQVRQSTAQIETQLREMTSSALATVTSQADNVLSMITQQVGTSLSGIIANPIGAFPADCIKLATTFLDKILLGVSGASGCIFREVERVQAIINTIYTRIDGIVTALVTADKDVRACITVLNGLPTYPRFPFCIAEAASKVAWVVGTAIPELLNAVAALYTAINNLPEEIIVCQTSNISKTIFEIGVTQIDNLRLCIQTGAEPAIVAIETALGG